ncbi:MAG: hypothetical protein UT61_C0016G0006 [Candidatus Woesebacteria bacterium GW2011_GWA1_39_8]|uniref:Uncharacterized protein n=1 Tax=Candidatus Woesebacteria bacterium GW2011_GWA1_39_8 TaxID=1618552 RepID=A0A0G0S5J3_9BACT|nr:MAG: hypothetical protein UT61_C0016G0006 [Candidatus Woesebacteria bacterium GW2011_GWA1_39_8]
MLKTREEVHNSILLQTVGHLENQGHTNIKADHIGYPYEQPTSISGYMPDITSFLNSVFQVTETETKESVGTQETANQWSAFSKATNGYSKKFVVNVPKTCLEDAKRFAQEKGIRVDGWLYDSRY